MHLNVQQYRVLAEQLKNQSTSEEPQVSLHNKIKPYVKGPENPLELDPIRAATFALETNNYNRIFTTKFTPNKEEKDVTTQDIRIQRQTIITKENKFPTLVFLYPGKSEYKGIRALEGQGIDILPLGKKSQTM